MIFDKDIIFIDNAAEAETSTEITNTRSDNLTLQISGDFDSATIYVEGKVDSEGSWEAMSVISFKTLELLESIEEAGEYQCCVTGIKHLRISVDSASGENLRVYGRLTY